MPDPPCRKESLLPGELSLDDFLKCLAVVAPCLRAIELQPEVELHLEAVCGEPVGAPMHLSGIPVIPRREE